MFEYQESDASDNPETNPGTGSLPLPPSGANSKRTRSLNPKKGATHALRQPCGNRSRSVSGTENRTIKILHALGYADPNDWSDPIPVPPSSAAATDQPNQWMVIMTKTLLIE